MIPTCKIFRSADNHDQSIRRPQKYEIFPHWKIKGWIETWGAAWQSKLSPPPPKSPCHRASAAALSADHVRGGFAQLPCGEYRRRREVLGRGAVAGSRGAAVRREWSWAQETSSDLRWVLPCPCHLSLVLACLFLRFAVPASVAVDPLWVLSESARPRGGKRFLLSLEGVEDEWEWDGHLNFTPWIAYEHKDASFGMCCLYIIVQFLVSSWCQNGEAKMLLRSYAPSGFIM